MRLVGAKAPRVPADSEDTVDSDDLSFPDLARTVPLSGARAFRARAARRAAHARRICAVASGFHPTTGSVAARGHDQMNPCLTKHDATRLMRSFPQVTHKATYDADEFAERVRVADTPVTAAALKVVQANVEAVVRHVLCDVQRNLMVARRSTITPFDLWCELSKYQPMMNFTGVDMPLGALAHAQEEGILPSRETHDDARVEAANTAVLEKREARRVNSKRRRVEHKLASEVAA